MSEEDFGVIRGSTPSLQQVLLSPPPEKGFQRVVIHRMTVVEQVYYQTDGESPISFDLGYIKHLQTGEEVYSRKTKTVAEETTPLDLGWMTDKPICTILIKNEEPNKVPDSRKTLEVKHGETRIMRIPPGESVRFIPEEPQKLSLYSEAETKFSVHVIPG